MRVLGRSTPVPPARHGGPSASCTRRQEESCFESKSETAQTFVPAFRVNRSREGASTHGFVFTPRVLGSFINGLLRGTGAMADTCCVDTSLFSLQKTHLLRRTLCTETLSWRKHCREHQRSSQELSS